MYYWYKKKWYGKSVVDRKDALDLDDEADESSEGSDCVISGKPELVKH